MNKRQQILEVLKKQVVRRPSKDERKPVAQYTFSDPVSVWSR